MKLYNYYNGNCLVEIFSDGTKVRSWEGEPKPEFSETIDLKITNYCDAGCKFCHERSTIHGKHAPIERVLNFILGLKPGIELAIGGGNPLDHPNLSQILFECLENDIIANLTVNQFHATQDKVISKLNNFSALGMIKGLGLSFQSRDIEKCKNINNEHKVIHIIAGVHSVEDALWSLDNFGKILILGFKTFGRGVAFKNQFPESVENSLNQFKWKLHQIMSHGGVVSFDNLAIEQLKPERFFTKENWSEIYMGDDGDYSEYVDLVKNEKAKTSRTPQIERIQLGS